MNPFDYKKTLNLSTTAFAMKANLSAKEPIMQQQGAKAQIYQQILQQNINQPQWVLHDGPPYANGNIHIGHAVNKILKDFIVRIKNFQGYYSPYIPGFDTHGLPIEGALKKQNTCNYDQLSPIEKRTACLNFAQSQIAKQTQQFQRLGLLTDFQASYATYQHQFEIDQLQIFLKILQKDLIYRALKPVYWSYSSKTALAEAEVVYLTKSTPSIYVQFPTVADHEFVPKNTQIIIWTTTPGTLPANLAIAIHPDHEYCLVLHNNTNYLVATSRLSELATLFHGTNYQVVSTMKGQQLEYLKYFNALINETHYLVLGEYVSGDNGSGLVHNAPGFGLDDYLVCQRYHIDVYCPIDQDGKYTQAVKIPELVGEFYETANAGIIEKLQALKMLVHQETITHAAAHDGRTNKPLFYRATEQGFINIDSIKQEIIQACQQVNSYPQWVLRQLIDTVSKRQEWCISRQRLGGVPIPILFDGNGEPILAIEQIQHIINILSEHGTDVWFAGSAEKFLAPQYQHLKNVTKSQDIMDVWFDSGTSYSILNHHQLQLPAQLYLEGNDQFRGWFNSSLITAIIAYGISPYQNLIAHGFILDEQGLKMSKSKGNVVDPLSVMEQYGADVLRLGVGTTDYTEDMRFGKIGLDQAINSYRKIRNTLFRFSLANLSDFDQKLHTQTTLAEVDYYVLTNFKTVLTSALSAGNQFNFAKGLKELNNFLNFYSSYYFNLVKDHLYCDQVNSVRRRQIQTVISEILHASLLLLAPFLPHTCEEAYQLIPNYQPRTSIHLHSGAQLGTFSVNEVNHEKGAQFFQLKDIVYAAIENARNEQVIKLPTEAHVSINDPHIFNHFTNHELAHYLMVAEVSLGTEIKVTKTQLNQCQRCKLYYPKSAMATDHLDQRCAAVLKLHN